MCKVLEGLEDIHGVYTDDIIVTYNTFDEHIVHVGLVLSRLLLYKLTGKLIKCFFACMYVGYLGHEIEQGITSPKLAK